jgi:hypothetical protein
MYVLPEAYFFCLSPLLTPNLPRLNDRDQLRSLGEDTANVISTSRVRPSVMFARPVQDLEMMVSASRRGFLIFLAPDDSAGFVQPLVVFLVYSER